MQVTQRIPSEKMTQFHEILCETGGRYLHNPLVIGTSVIVYYEPGDYTTMNEAWSRCITPIKEVNRNQWWRVLMRRCGITI